MIGYHLINECFSYGTFNTLCKVFHGNFLLLLTTEGNRLVCSQGRSFIAIGSMIEERKQTSLDRPHQP